jgi:hypothetical protein
MVVNGENQFVGSNKNEAEKTIKNALTIPTNLAIDLAFSEKKLSYNLRRVSSNFNFSDCTLIIAIVQNEATNFVKRGENSGKTLTHNNVVRYFQKLKIRDEKGEISINLPENASKIIVFAQNPVNGKIFGATEMVL